MKPVVAREFVREFPRFVARAREGEVIEIRHRDGALFTFALKSGGRPRPRKAATTLDPKAFAQVDLDSPALLKTLTVGGLHAGDRMPHLLRVSASLRESFSIFQPHG